MTFASFQVSGNIPSLNDLLIKIHRGLETDLETPLSILWLMPSSSLALLGFRTSIIVSISYSVQFISERELSVSFEKGGNRVCSSFTVEIEAK